MLNYLKGFVASGEQTQEVEYEFIYIYFSASYNHVKIGRSINKKTLKGRYSVYKTQDNSAMMIAYETRMCNTIEEYLRERVLSTFRLNGEQSKKSDECYRISLTAAKYAINYTIAKIEYQLILDNGVNLNPEILYCLCTYSKDDPEILTYKEDNKITIIPYKQILLCSDTIDNVATSLGNLSINEPKKKTSVTQTPLRTKESSPVTRTPARLESKQSKQSSTGENNKSKPTDGVAEFVFTYLKVCKEEQYELVDAIYIAYSEYVEKMKTKLNIYNCGRSPFSPRLKSALGIDKLQYVNSKPCVYGYKLVKKV